MNSEMQKRLYEMEVMPPAAVWEKLSANIDEINEDNRLAKKVLNAELVPPAGVWEMIDTTINLVEEERAPKKTKVIYLRRLAAAAIFVGLIVTGWLLYSNSKKSTEVANINPTEQSPSTATHNTTPKADPDPGEASAPEQHGIAGSEGTLVSVPDKGQLKRARTYNSGLRNKNNFSIEPGTPQYAVANAPLNKSFDRPIDDLSLVTSDQNYLTMVNSNGRLVKIPAELASLAPHLQDKPVSEDHYEILFGEGSYWKETLNEWRKKVVSAPVTPGDAFTSFVELLKNVQNR